MTTESSPIFIVDDDASIRKSLSRLLTTAGYQVESFSSATEFLEKNKSAHKGCLVLDLSMPGLNGLELQDELLKRNLELSIVFITGHGDIRSSVRAMKNGAIDFLPKPFDQAEILQAVERALVKNVQIYRQHKDRSKVDRSLEKLTPRERELLPWVIAGYLNKQIALKLGITEKTVKVHRGQVMAKMGATSVAQLVRLAEIAGVAPAAKK